MAEEGPGAATLLLDQWRGGDMDAREQLLGLLQGEMRAIARRLMKGERSSHTLQPTAVANEACLRLLGGARTPASSRADFLGLAARVMRQVLVDHARRRDAEKRGGDWQRVSLRDESSRSNPDSALVDALDLDAALDELAALSPRQAQVAELRYFAGLSIPEVAAALEVGQSTVKAEWGVARLWLQRRLREGAGDEPDS